MWVGRFLGVRLVLRCFVCFGIFCWTLEYRGSCEGSWRVGLYDCIVLVCFLFRVVCFFGF